jgi:hypothetical protein
MSYVAAFVLFGLLILTAVFGVAFWIKDMKTALIVSAVVFMILFWLLVLTIGLIVYFM